MRKDKNSLDTPQTKQKFGFLYNGYKRHNYFWEIIIMYRKIFCIMIAVFLQGQGIILQALVLLVLLIVFLNANASRRPFQVRKLNDIEGMSLTTQLITIYCGVFFISAKDDSLDTFDVNNDFALSDDKKLFFFFIILACNVFFILFWASEFVDAYKNMIKKRTPGLYVTLFLCCRERKMKFENAKVATTFKRETIVQKVEDIVLFMNKMKSLYIRDIKYEDHERFLSLCYAIDSESKQIVLTEKKHNFYIQGPIARPRKYDKGRIDTQKLMYEISVQDDFIKMMQDRRRAKLIN